MLTERSIINFLIWVGGMIAGPYLAMSAVSGNLMPLEIVGVVAAVAFIFGMGRDNICLLPLVALFWSGKFNFLPLHLGPGDLANIALIAYYVIAYVALQRKKVKTGPMFFFIPIMVIVAIVLYHEHNFGLRSMGEGREGSRGAFFLLLACVTYFCGVSVNSPSPRFLASFPLWCLFASVLSSIPYTATTYFPRSAPYFYLFTDSINITAYTAEVLDTEGIVRNSGQAGVGGVLMGILISYYPIFTWWRPHRWWVAILGIACCVVVVNGGFRSTFAGFALMILVGTWCYYSWRTLFLVPVLAMGIFLATAAQDSHLVHLPQSAQRSLSFLPGNWDPEVADTAASSNDFRAKIQATYMKEYFRKSPLLGEGFSYDSDEFAKMTALGKEHDTADGYYAIKSFVVSKQFHIGWISVYDAVGIVGMAAFIFMGLSLIFVSAGMVFGPGADRKSALFPLKVWLVCGTVPSFIGYFTVFGDFKAAFPGFCFFAVLWVHLDRLERKGYIPNEPTRQLPLNPISEEYPIHA